MADEKAGRLSLMWSYLARGGLSGILAALLAVGVSELYAGIFRRIAVAHRVHERQVRRSDAARL